MTVRDTLLREHRFLEKLLERLQSAFRADERGARLETRRLLILMAPCLEAHLGIERLIFRRGAKSPAASPDLEHGLRVRALQAELAGLLEHGDAQPYIGYREAVLRLVTRIRARLQAEGAWRPRHASRPVDVVRSVTRRVDELERRVENTSAALDAYLR